MKQYLEKIERQFVLLFEFSRRINEIDFAASLSMESRGCQSPGWKTTITAEKVFEEISSYSRKEKFSESEIRIILMLYCQLAEAGGVYEALKNLIGVVQEKPYSLWPFDSLVRVRKVHKRIIGPNSNATFRELGRLSHDIGMPGLADVFENAFDDAVRNAIYHCDYILWDDGLRIRNRNGGNARSIEFQEVLNIVNRGIVFYDCLRVFVANYVRSFEPPKTIIGRFSANPPMPWRIAYDSENGSFSISSSSPGIVESPEYLQQQKINDLLGGRVLAVYYLDESDLIEGILASIRSIGFEPTLVEMGSNDFLLLHKKVDEEKLWDGRIHEEQSNVLVLSPWGFCFGNEFVIDEILRLMKNEE